MNTNINSNKSRRSKLVIAILTLTMLLGTTSMAFASVSTIDIGVNRISNTAASVSAKAVFVKKAAYAKCKLTLQERYSGSWRTATNVIVKKVVREKYNTISIYVPYKFALVKGKVYRIKATVTDKRNGVSTTRSYCSTSF